MALFNRGNVEYTIENSIKNPDELEQLIIADEAYKMNDEEIREFCEPGGLGERLVMEGKMKNKTLVRLSRKDDLARRKKMICYQLAKEANDPSWEKFKFHRDKALIEENKMFRKYGMKADRLAKESQKEYLKGDSGSGKHGLLRKFGADDR